MPRRRRVRAESRSRYYIRKEAEGRGWNGGHVASGGDCLEENEIVGQFSDIGLGLDRPDFLYCIGGSPAVVVEAKNEAAKLDQAVAEATGYADQINAHGKYRVDLAVGAAGEEETGFVVEVRFLSPSGWVPLEAHGHELTAFPSRAETELAVIAGDGSTTVSVPADHEFIDAAVEVSRILRTAKVEAPLRPKVIGALVTAMYQGQIDTATANALSSVNQLAEAAIRAATDIPDATKDLLAETLRLTSADFDRLAPSIRRIVAILRRLNVRAVLQTDTDFLGMFYEAFLRYGYDNNALGIVFTPRHITRYCAELTEVSPTDRVIDVASGTGGFLVAAFDRMIRDAKSQESVAQIKESIAGFDTNPTVWALSMLNMFFRGDGKSHVVHGSCFDTANRTAVRRNFTRAFLNPPFSQDEEPEIDFLDAAMDALEPQGILAAVVYAGVFADDHHRLWRREFLRRHTLLGMISLPEDLFYPTAAPTSIILAEAHVPMPEDGRALMARVWNDGYEKLKGRRVERGGSQLGEVAEAFAQVRGGADPTSPLATTVDAAQLGGGAEWSPQQWLPQPALSSGALDALQHAVLRSAYQAVAQYPELADEALDDFGAAWQEFPTLPYGEAHPLSHFFQVVNGRSVGEKNYSDGTTPYVSSGDARNSIIRLISASNEEVFDHGAITVTAFGAASLQPWPFAARGNGGSSVRVLVPRYQMSVRELLWFAAQINAQRWRYFYARMSIKGRIERLMVTSPDGALTDRGDALAANLVAFRDKLEELSGVTP
jgi:type I restriction enzyme M protein